MSQSVFIYNALCLPTLDIEALTQGQIITAIPKKFINSGEKFALCPISNSINLSFKKQYYQDGFLQKTQNLITQKYHETTIIKAWAKCELCQMLNDRESLDALSTLTIWTKAAFEEILNQRPYIFLAYLRVYLLDEPLEVALESQGRQFVPLPNSISASDARPILDDETFAQRKKQLENLEIPLQLESKESDTEDETDAGKTEYSVETLLFSKDKQTTKPPDYSDLAWISKIAEVGNSSDGHEFERLVRKSLIKIGFSCSNNNPKANLDPNKLGGAGGLDFYCEYPYQVVGECKATKSEKVPSKTPAQLIQLGHKHLPEKYNNCLKIIFAAGELTDDALLTALNNEMNVIRPETLQKLVELQAHNKNSVNLMELKECLQQKPYGLADDKVNEYIKKVEESIELRSHIIQIVKNYLENSEYERAGVEALHAIYTVSNPSQKLSSQELYHILIELASPLTGYLGRIKGEDWRRDRFYYLRDLD